MSSLSPDPADNAPADSSAGESCGVNRLAEAMELFLAARDLESDEQRQRFLQQNEHLRDLLEPMFEDDDADDDAPAAEELMPGRVIGDYRIVREVGRGGMGTVFEAQQISLDRRVALKVLHAQQTLHAASIHRFRREAAASARLRHRGIVPIYEVGEWQGMHFFSMEFVEGRSLKQLVHDDNLGVESASSRARQAAEVVVRVADALQHAHEHDLIHRDVKPQNIMIGDDGTVWLLDFGLVKNIADDTASITAGFFGTPHYSSPEQVLPDRVVGPATDVFSLGIVLYELLARRRPFEGESSRAVMQCIEAGEFESLRRTAPSTPSDLVTICHKSLEPSPADRYPTAREFADDLRRFLNNETILARPPGLLVRSWKWSRRNRARLVLWAAAAMLVLGGPIAYALQQHHTRQAVEHERKVLGDAEELGFRSIEQTLSLVRDFLHRLPGPPRENKKQVDLVVRQCEEFLELRAKDPGRRQRVAKALLQTSGVYSQLGDSEQALATCRRVEEILATTEGAEPYIWGRLRVRAASLRQISDPFGKHEDFEREVRQFQADPSLGGAAAFDLIEALILGAQAQIANAEDNEEALRMLRIAEQILPESWPEPDRLARFRLRVRAKTGIAELRAGRFDKALEHLQPVLDELRAMPQTPITAVLRVQTELAIAEAHRLTGKGGTEEAALRNAIDRAERLLHDYPGTASLRATAIGARIQLSTRLLGRGNVDDALRMIESIDANDLDNGSRTWRNRAMRAQIDMQLASCKLTKEQTDARGEARELLESACDRFEQLIVERPDQLEMAVGLAAALSNLAALENRAAHHDDAERFARRAIDIQRRVLDIAPDNRRSRLFHGIHQSQLAFALACQQQLGDPKEIAAAVRVTFADAGRHLNALQMAALASSHCADRMTRSGSFAKPLIDEVAEVAIESLQRMVAVGGKKAYPLVQVARFQTLAGRPGYDQLMESLQ